MDYVQILGLLDYNRNMILQAHAKINLTLDVLHKRPDGYHALESLMQCIDLFDRIYMEPTEGKALSVTADTPLPAENTAIRAARGYMERFGSNGAHIHIEKHIPSEAGLGGGSADAAAVLRGMQAFYGQASTEALFALAKAVGADVPFCLHGGCALCEGVGEEITPLPSLPLSLLLVKPAQGVRTEALFQALPLPVPHPDTAGARAAIMRGDVAALARRAENALEPSAAALVPSIAAYKARLLQQGALGASMSGSGSTVFGIFENEAAARAARAAFPDAAFVTCARTI